jgi:hypothetical protein
MRTQDFVSVGCHIFQIVTKKAKAEGKGDRGTWQSMVRTTAKIIEQTP